MEIKYRRGRKKAWKDEELASDYNAGMKIKDIKKKYSISKSGMYLVLDRVSKTKQV